MRTGTDRIRLYEIIFVVALNLLSTMTEHYKIFIFHIFVRVLIKFYNVCY